MAMLNNNVHNKWFFFFPEAATAWTRKRSQDEWGRDYFCPMHALPPNWQQNSRERQKLYRQLLKRADKRKTIRILPQLHDEAFSKIDCMQCAGCCKNYSPRFKTPDIKRISRFLGLKESAFIEQYLRLDEDGDYVVRTTPCPFLGPDNACSIYEARPSDCARFPYTDEDVFVHRPNITLKNSEFCPAVHMVLEALLSGDPSRGYI
ncbi:MAG TPA: YkgJ family cysteine cluster protein [Phnomibacter sp.]|nr:YkgJ family cysteine cluster protein [Phnomibacter sp.]